MGQQHSGENCVFCRIVSGDIPSPRLYEDDHFICIRDVQPQAKTHLLLVSKEHVVSLDELFSPGNKRVAIGELALKSATEAARKLGLLPGGFRLVINTGADGGQTVFHLHIHLLGGQSLREHFG